MPLHLTAQSESTETLAAQSEATETLIAISEFTEVQASGLFPSTLTYPSASGTYPTAGIPASGLHLTRLLED